MGREVGGGSGWGTYVNPWLIHVNVWQKPLQYCKIISLQLIKINEKNYGNVKEKLIEFKQSHDSGYHIGQCKRRVSIPNKHIYNGVKKKKEITQAEKRANSETNQES